nr:putative 1-acyl-sn-glycerol-3-phosphate acyltransferase [uncultured bacterium]
MGSFDRVGNHYWATRRVTWPVRKLWLDVELIKPENVPRDGPVILAANHLSFLDSPLLMFSLPRQVSILGKAEYLDSRWTRWLFPASGMIPVDRSGRGLVESMRHAEARLADGEIVGIFPEGTRSRSGGLHRGHPGVAHLALHSGAPIVPVGVTGTDCVQPPGARMPRRGKVQLRFGSPIDLGRWAGRAPTSGVKREIADAVMVSIRALTGQSYVDEFAAIPQEPVTAQ